MARALFSSGGGDRLDFEEIAFVDPRAETLDAMRSAIPAARTFSAIYDVPAGFRNGILFFAVKPQDLNNVFRELEDANAPWMPGMIITILAGVPVGVFEKKFPKIPVVRAMPNTPAKVCRGVTALCGNAFSEGEPMATATGIFGRIGRVVRVGEECFDAVTALSGSGPAYYYLLAAALAEAGIAEGLEENTAIRLAVETMAGAGELARTNIETGETLSEMITAVRSKGGTTEAALEVFEKRDFQGVVREAVAAARERAAVLGKRISEALE